MVLFVYPILNVLWGHDIMLNGQYQHWHISKRLQCNWQEKAALTISNITADLNSEMRCTLENHWCVVIGRINEIDKKYNVEYYSYTEIIATFL